MTMFINTVVSIILCVVIIVFTIAGMVAWYRVEQYLKASKKPATDPSTLKLEACNTNQQVISYGRISVPRNKGESVVQAKLRLATFYPELELANATEDFYGNITLELPEWMQETKVK